MLSGRISQTTLSDHRATAAGWVTFASGYQGQTEVIQEAAAKVQDMTCKRTRFKNYVDENQKKKNRSKSSVRAKVEHVFCILKRVFSFDMVRYRVSVTGVPSRRLLPV